MIKAVLLDMDGTITDTEKIYNKAWINAHHECGYLDYGFEEALMQRSLNRPMQRQLWKDRFGEDYDWDAVHDIVTEYVLEATKNGVECKPGIHELVAYLDEKKIPAAVVTATGKEMALARLEKAGIKDLFKIVISAHEVKRGKPFPDVYEFAAAELGLDPHDCIAVEDSPNGVRSAHDAGCKTIMVPDLAEPDPETESLLFAKCRTLADIIDILNH